VSNTGIFTLQGFGNDQSERIPLPDRETMNEAQRVAADAIIAGPRKAVFGPFVPLLQCPGLMERIGKVGESLRFDGRLDERIRELVICFVARETHNQFEWQTHVPLAIKAGSSPETLDAIAVGARPRGISGGDETALDFASELMRRHGVCDATYAAAVGRFGEPGVVELVALIGYFVMVCWVMNVARTPGPKGTETKELSGLPG